MENTNKVLTTKAVAAYSAGIFGLQLFIGYVNSYQSQFYTSQFSANLMVVAIIILGAKLISAVVDPFIGRLIDNSRFKSGKMRPFVLMSAFPITIITTLLFVYIPFKSDIGMYVYVTFTTVLWNVAMSFADIPSQGMLALLSPHATERNACAGFANTTKSVALAAPGVMMTVVMMITGNTGVDPSRKEYLILALAIATIGLACYLLIYLFNRETIPPTKTSMSFKNMVAELKDNRMLMLVFLTFMLGFGRNMAMGISVQAGATLLREGVTVFGEHFSGVGINWILGLTSGVTAMISIMTVPLINKKWGEKKTFIVFGIYGFAVSICAFFLYAFGGAALRSLWAILAYQFFLGFAFGPHGYLPMVMVSDIVDYREWQTHKRTEGVQFAVLSLSNKISNALSVAVGIFIVGASGYVGTMTGADITDKMQTIVFSAYILIPGICMLLACIPMLKYKIDAKTKQKMRAELAERRAS